MSRLYTVFKVVALFVGCAFYCNYSFADLLLQSTSGISVVENDDYDPSLFVNASIGYGMEGWGLHLGYAYLGEFELSEDTRNIDGDVESHGFTLKVSKVFNANFVDIDIGLGLSQIKSEAKLSNRVVGSTKDTAPFAEIMVAKEFTSLFGAHVGLSYFDDVAGTDVYLIGMGVRLKFQ